MIWLLQVTPPAVIPVSPVDLTATSIAVIVTGVVTVIGAIVAGAVSIIAAVKKGNAEATDKRTEMGDKISQNSVTLDRVEILVDGRYSQVLQELADIKKQLAVATGLAADQVKADHAQNLADDQAARVTAAPKVGP